MHATYFESFLKAVAACPDRMGILGEEHLIFPPDPDYGYEATPRNALTFGAMGVDGVHYAILTTDGAVKDDSPVIQISPIDSDAYAALAESFLGYLAHGCDASATQMDAIFQQERSGRPTLVEFLRQHFDGTRFFDDSRYEALARYLDFIELKPGFE